MTSPNLPMTTFLGSSAGAWRPRALQYGDEAKAAELAARTQILIPMSGFGERFKAAGYQVPKPLIPVAGKPIIAHVVDLFPGSTDFVFVCNREHLERPEWRMREILEEIAPGCSVVAVEPHKLGPVHAALLAEGALDPDRPVMLSYCDYACLWDWAEFLVECDWNEWHGAIPAYRGFHPHSLGSTQYAYLKLASDKAPFLVEDIREKQSWTDRRMDEFASSGGYWFKSARLMFDCFREQVARGIALNGEFYASLAYKVLFERKAPVGAYPLRWFFQWGTPQDLREFEGFFSAFAEIASWTTPWGRSDAPPEPGSLRAIPMAGMGSRFESAGWKTPKPLIPVSGVPMALAAAESLPASEALAALLRSGMPGASELAAAFASVGGAAFFVDAPTDGQARSLALLLKALAEKGPLPAGPLWVGACDGAAPADPAEASRFFAEGGLAVAVCAAPPPAALRKPTSYGWAAPGPEGSFAEAPSGTLIPSPRWLVKESPERPEHALAFTGSFAFASAQTFLDLFDRLEASGAKVNGEYYLDSVMALAEAVRPGASAALRAKVWLGWGTPDELSTFEYWQGAFHSWNLHPYRIESDLCAPNPSAVPLEPRLCAPFPESPVARPAP